MATVYTEKPTVRIGQDHRFISEENSGFSEGFKHDLV